mmetsp:Transcript_93947/g.214848  ORF Transcript_93947/g.214848 Transcript_93947/m.214848 type:complete len:619 (+) Transcript_93947:119-1975(+)
MCHSLQGAGEIALLLLGLTGSDTGWLADLLRNFPVAMRCGSPGAVPKACALLSRSEPSDQTAKVEEHTVDAGGAFCALLSRSERSSHRGEVEQHTVDVGGARLRLLHIPSLVGQQMSAGETQQILGDIAGLGSLHVVVLVLSGLEPDLAHELTRATDEICAIWSPAARNHIVLVFTDVSKVEDLQLRPEELPCFVERAVPDGRLFFIGDPSLHWQLVMQSARDKKLDNISEHLLGQQLAACERGLAAFVSGVAGVARLDVLRVCSRVSDSQQSPALSSARASCKEPPAAQSWVPLGHISWDALAASLRKSWCGLSSSRPVSVPGDQACWDPSRQMGSDRMPHVEIPESTTRGTSAPRTTRGDAFDHWCSTNFPGGSDPLEERHVLFTGPTGSGKSSLLRLLRSFPSVLRGGRQVVAASLRNFSERSQPCDLANDGMASIADQVVAHNLEYGPLRVRIVDSPGLGDTRGLAFDQQHKQRITDHVSRHGGFHAIAVVIDGRSAPSQQLAYAVGQACSTLPLDWQAHAVVVFTNVRKSNEISPTLRLWVEKNISGARHVLVENPFVSWERSVDDAGQVTDGETQQNLVSEFMDVQDALGSLFSHISGVPSLGEAWSTSSDN